MRLETFRGPDIATVSAMARAALGDDVMVLSTEVVRENGRRLLEITAASAGEVERMRLRVRTQPGTVRDPRGRNGPLVIALVGPTGAGKTTTIAKLAVNPDAFGTYRVGLLALDTYRAGALEQLQTYAEIARLPLEIVYDLREVMPAMRRLERCDVILVDTPGRSPRAKDLNQEWQDVLRIVGADEIHLVIPATIRPDIALAVRDSFDAIAPTHLLLTKLDEVPNEIGVAELAVKIDLPARWTTDGQEVPTDIASAASRLTRSVGLLAPDESTSSASGVGLGASDSRRPLHTGVGTARSAFVGQPSFSKV